MVSPGVFTHRTSGGTGEAFLNTPTPRQEVASILQDDPSGPTKLHVQVVIDPNADHRTHTTWLLDPGHRDFILTHSSVPPSVYGGCMQRGFSSKPQSMPSIGRPYHRGIPLCVASSGGRFCLPVYVAFSSQFPPMSEHPPICPYKMGEAATPWKGGSSSFKRSPLGEGMEGVFCGLEEGRALYHYCLYYPTTNQSPLPHPTDQALEEAPYGLPGCPRGLCREIPFRGSFL